MTKSNLSQNEGKNELIEKPNNIELKKKYQQARRQLDRGIPLDERVDLDSSGYYVVGRNSERNQLTQFLNNCITTQTSGAMYISGQPGTGKTALVKDCLATSTKLAKETAGVCHFNCVSVNGPKNLLPALIPALPKKILGNNKKKFDEPLDHLRALVTSGKGILVVVLDELDHILVGSIGQKLLYDLMDLVHIPKSQLVLVGIANDLNLIDQSLPRLRVRGWEPQHLKFPPYDVIELQNILTHLLAAGDLNSICDPSAVEMCARKVAGNGGGDLRKAMDLLRQALSLAEAEDCSSMNLTHIQKAELSVLGSPALRKIMSLPIHAQLILVAIVQLRPEPLISSKVFDKYHKVCESTTQKFEPITRSEYVDLLALLETTGLITMTFAAAKRKRKGQPMMSNPDPTLDILLPESNLRMALMRNELLKDMVTRIPSKS